MIRLNKENINTPEHFNKKFFEHGGDIKIEDMPRFFEMTKRFKGGRLLDVGCYHSPVAMEIRRRFPKAEVYALDIADEMIRVLAERYPHIYYTVGNAYELPFYDDYFDYITAGELIEHLEEPQRFVDECNRVLKKGGVVAVSTPKEESGKGSIGGAEHLWSFNLEDMENLFEKYKFEKEIKTIKEGRNEKFIAFYTK